MSTFNERLEERMLSMQYADDDDTVTDTAFMAGAKAALLLAAEEQERLVNSSWGIEIATLTESQGIWRCINSLRTLAASIGEVDRG